MHKGVHVCDPCDRSRATLFPSADKACLDCAIRVRNRVGDMLKENRCPANQQLAVEMALLVHRKLLDQHYALISQMLAMKGDADKN